MASALGVSAKLTTTALARDSAAATSTSRRDASPYTTESPAAAASRTRSGSESSAITGIFSRSRKCARAWPLRP